MDSYIVAYDISDPKRLRKVATVCEDFGYRKQLSVFLCRLSPTDFVRLRSRLYDLINLSRIRCCSFRCAQVRQRDRGARPAHGGSRCEGCGDRGLAVDRNGNQVQGGSS